MKKLTVSLASLAIVPAALALELTGPYVIDTSTEYSEDVTGSGYFVVTEGATLTLSGKDNSFSGGVIVSNGVVEAKTAKALGTGTVRLEGRAADTCCLKLYPDWTTCNNSVVVGGEARGSSGSNPSIDFVGSTTLGGSISFDPSLAANSSAYINIRVKDDTDNHWATVNGELNAGVGKVQMKGKGNLALNGKVTTSYLALGTSWSDYGSVTLKSSDNEIKEVLLRTYTLTCGAPNVLKGCHFRFYFEDSWSSPRWGSARLNLNGFDQELRDIHSSPDNKISTSLSRTNQNTLWVQNSKNPCTLTFTGSETAYTSGKTYAYFSGPISIVVGGELNPEPGLYQGFLMRPNTMTGSITARKGQARFLASTAGSSEFPNVTNLVVKSGASLSFEASAKKVFTGLRTIEVEEGGKIGVDKTCVEPINSPYAALKLGAKADLRFPNGVTNTVKKAFVNGQQLFPGVYTKALLPDHMANSGDTGALVVLKGPGLELLVR